MANKIEYIFSLQDKISAKLGGITTTSDKTTAALTSVREKVKTVDAIFGDTGRTLGSLKVKIDALQSEREWIPADNIPAIKEYNKQINRLTGELNDLETAASGGKFKNWAKDAFNALPGSEFFANPLVAGAAAVSFSGKSAMDFDEDMAKVNLTAQLDEKGLSDLSDKVKEITTRNKADITFAPVGLEKIISQTGDLGLSLDILDQVQRGAKAGFVDMDTVAGALSQTLSVVGKENTNAAEVLDTFFAAKRVGAGEFADFARYMPGLIAGAKNMGIAYKEVAGTFAYMTGKGQTAERAAVLMENAFSVLGRGDVRDKLSLAGVDVFDDAGKMRGLVDIFGELQGVMGAMNDEQKSSFLEKIGIVDKEAKNAFSILTSDVDKFNTSMRDVSNATGETDAALSLSQNSVQKATEVWNQFKSIGFTVGEILLPVINVGLGAVDIVLSGLSTTLNFVVDLFSDWFSYLRDGNPLVWGLTAAVGVCTIALTANKVASLASAAATGVKNVAYMASTAVTRGLTAAQSALNAVFYASPLGWIAVVIGVVVGAIALCWQKFEGFRVAVYGAWEVVKEFGKSLVDSVVAPFKQVLNGVGGVCSALVNLVKGNFKEAAAEAKAGFKDIGLGVVQMTPAGLAYNTIKGGDYKGAWAEGKQNGHDSWARSQEITTPASPIASENPLLDEQTPAKKIGGDISTVVAKVPKAAGSKILDLNDDKPRNLSESSTYSAITRSLLPKSVSMLPKLAASVALPIAMAATPTDALASSSDAYALPKRESSYITEPNTINNGGKRITVDKVCDQIVIHIKNTDEKGTDTIKEEIMKILEELGDE